MNDNDYLFSKMYERVIHRYFPKVVIAGKRSSVDFNKLTGIVAGVAELSNLVDKICWEDGSAVESNELKPSSLEEHLTQKIVGCIHKLLIQQDEIEVSKINPEYVKHRFHQMLIACAFPQISGDQDIDDLFNLEEVKIYARVNRLSL